MFPMVFSFMQLNVSCGFLLGKLKFYFIFLCKVSNILSNKSLNILAFHQQQRNVFFLFSRLICDSWPFSERIQGVRGFHKSLDLLIFPVNVQQFLGSASDISKINFLCLKMQISFFESFSVNNMISITSVLIYDFVEAFISVTFIGVFMFFIISSQIN